MILEMATVQAMLPPLRLDSPTESSFNKGFFPSAAHLLSISDIAERTAKGSTIIQSKIISGAHGRVDIWLPPLFDFRHQLALFFFLSLSFLSHEK
jgi:hypothetical protein